MSSPDLQCSPRRTFAEAEAICQAAGARLCTTAELVKGCTAGTGCGYDAQLVWGTVPDPPPPSPPSPPSVPGMAYVSALNLGPASGRHLLLKIPCPTCTSARDRRSHDNGNVYVSFRGDDAAGSTYGVDNTIYWLNTFEGGACTNRNLRLMTNRVHVHYQRTSQNPSELWTTLGEGESYEIAGAAVAIHVCTINSELNAVVTVGADPMAAGALCTGTSRPPPSSPPPPPPPSPHPPSPSPPPPSPPSPSPPPPSPPPPTAPVVCGRPRACSEDPGLKEVDELHEVRLHRIHPIAARLSADRASTPPAAAGAVLLQHPALL